MTSRPRSARSRPLGHLAGLLAPLIAFVVLVQTLGNATVALAITDAIPLLWVLGYGIWRRRIEPVGATAVVLFAIALLVTIASGGSSLPLELHRAVFPGAVGLACLTSVAARRPLLAIASSRLEGQRALRGAAPRATLDARGPLTALTAIIGVTLVTDAAAQVTLALTVSTSTFGVVARVASWVTIGTGLAVCVLYLRRRRTRPQSDRGAPPRSESGAAAAD